VSTAVITVEDVHLSFPIVRYRARGVKEAFLELVTGRRHPDRKRDFWALNGVSFEVQRGEVIGLVGRNGSGKSTLLRVVCGIYEPDKGHVETKGRISSLLELGAGFRDELTGYENIKLSGAISGYAPEEMEQLADKIVEFADLDEFIHQPLRTYSSGMRARLGFSVAAAVKPEILLIDEALAVGDAAFRQRSVNRIEEMVKDEDATVVIVSHNMEELKRLCTRMILLERGEVVTQGDIPDVVKAYAELTRAKKKT
jgi:ABC-type polysaccharide/polyol phosphate transport system ATPase subunit